VSSHNKRWIVDRAKLRQARSEDLQYVESPDHIDFLNIYFASLIAMLGKRLNLRQRVIATATVFFQAILRQKLVLRDRAFYRDSCMLLRCRKGRGIPCPYQKCRLRVASHVQPGGI